jgi:short-subunit dehydrogenase
VVVNNAGVGITGAIGRDSTIEMKNHFDTNFFGPIEVMKLLHKCASNRRI